MSASTADLQPAYLLHHREFRETSLIVDIFSLNAGRLALVARGARKAKPVTRMLYQPFRPLLVSWVGSSGLRTLTQIESSGEAPDLQAERLACAYYLNELLLRLLGEDQSQTALFAHYTRAVSQLSEADTPYESVIRLFELQLLDTLGVLPDFSSCTADGEQVQEDRQYLYYPGNAVAAAVGLGTQPTAENVQLTEAAASEAVALTTHPDGITRVPAVPVRGKTLLALSRFDVHEPDVREDARKLMRTLLKLQLGERPLNSREYFRSIAGLGGEQPDQL